MIKNAVKTFAFRFQQNIYYLSSLYINYTIHNVCFQFNQNFLSPLGSEIIGRKNVNKFYLSR